MTSNNLPTIVGIEINTDEQGRFNLNALHKASGESASKAPNEWLRNESTKRLITELTGNSPLGQDVIISQRGGTTPGTFADELLAVSYAGWISPGFQLKVNQVFIDYRTGKLAPERTELQEATIVLDCYREAARIFGFEGNQALLSANQATLNRTGTNFLKELGHDKLVAPKQEQVFIPTELGEMFDVSAKKINSILHAVGLQSKIRDHKNRLKWELTDRGTEYGEYIDTGKTSGGAPVKQIKWNGSVADVIADYIRKE